jgi:hypothetical protein
MPEPSVADNTRRELLGLGAQHDLPMLRVHRAHERARQIAGEHDLDRQVVFNMVEEILGIIGEGTKRYGHLCTKCRSLLVTEKGKQICPQHDWIPDDVPRVLLIAFDPTSHG